MSNTSAIGTPRVFSPTVTVIDPVIRSAPAELESSARKLRVAAYARVSTEQDEQQNSYEAQVSYYTQHIRSNTNWEFAGIYSDEGISGTNTKKREGFNQMIKDAEAGQIDLILTKSISRFARNTVDTLQTVRHLKELGVEVVFEKENLHSFDPKGEMLLTIMSSLAQEESRSISENVKWGHRRSMEEGNVHIAYSKFLGYRKGKDGRPEIVPEEAEIVQSIYNDYLSGMTIQNIARKLTAAGVNTPGGKEKWSVSTIRSILSNEKYKGDALLQKTITTDFLTKKSKKNEGEAKQYYVKNSHPAIIPPEKFDLVQQLLKQRGKDKNKIQNNSPFNAKIVCGDCDNYFGHKVFHGKDKYRTDVWYCNHRYEGDKVCSTPIIKETQLKAAFTAALGQNLAQIAATKPLPAPDAQQGEAEAQRLEKARETAEQALNRAVAELRELLQDNARRSQDQNAFQTRYNELSKKVETHKATLTLAEDAIIDHTARKEKLRRFAEATTQLSPDSVDFSAELFTATVEKVTVSSLKDGSYSLAFCFTNGAMVMIPQAEKNA